MPYTKPKKFRLGEHIIEAFPVSYLSNALGRTSQTIRKWEIAGIIPRCFVDPKTRVRYYSQEHIDIIVSCAERCKITQGRSLSRSSFANQVKKEIANSLKKYKS